LITFFSFTKICISMQHERKCLNSGCLSLLNFVCLTNLKISYGLSITSRIQAFTSHCLMLVVVIWYVYLVPIATLGLNYPSYILLLAHKVLYFAISLVVGFQSSQAGPPRGEYWPAALPLRDPVCSLLQWGGNSGCLL